MPLSQQSSEERTQRSIASKANAQKEGSIKMGRDALAGAVEIVEGRLYYNSFVRDPRSYDSDFANYTYIASRQQVRDDDHDHNQNVTKRKVHLFSIDSELVYWNFFLDFGPLNLGQLFRFCQKLNTKLQDPRLANRVICFFSNSSFEKRANAMYLLAAWQVLYMRRTPEEACSFFQSAIFSAKNSAKKSKQNSPRSVIPRTGNALDPIPPFHDASPCECTYDLNILDCLRGLVKARANNFFDFETFDVKEYEYFEQVENGDLNWIVRNKFLAFAGPQWKKTVTREGCYTLTAGHYIPYFKSRNVGLVVRLNKAMYDENEFKQQGIDHFEQYYTDGSCPTLPMLRTILEAFESVDKDKGIAVHCKAGLGRTGTCIGAYMMKHYKFTAKEAIGWMRICRPGMVIGPQQHFLEDIEQQMWYEGEVMKLRPSAGLSAKTERVKKGRSGSLSGPIKELSVADHEVPLYDQDSEAVRGRKGQAEALLTRRGAGAGTRRQRAP